jgi:hypothetical protein
MSMIGIRDQRWGFVPYPPHVIFLRVDNLIALWQQVQLLLQQVRLSANLPKTVHFSSLIRSPFGRMRMG